ncbi:hypothetical protein M9Y10_031065 [Tritrichomonas musculus]|uniref:HNH nuclease domain-containing protein n=1 Tax=Tritrichomonas musculus TaxID=1915356 RepID=A0ABR2H1P8_9EUKA
MNQGLDYEKLLREAIQEIHLLREENEKLKEEIKQLNESLYENDEWNAGIISNLKNEMKELKQRVENLENTVDYDDIVYPEAETEEEAQWFDVKDDDDYEIKNIYPYDIRRKKDEKIITNAIDKKSGYIKVALNRKPYYKHILMAKHFINNDDPINKKIVDHIDHDRTNYNTKNLRWVSVKDNIRNKYEFKGQKYNYLDNLPNDCQQITLFNGWEFSDYFIDSENKIWFYNGNQFRELTVYKKRSYLYVGMIDINNRPHNIGLNALIQEFN